MRTRSTRSSSSSILGSSTSWGTRSLQGRDRNLAGVRDFGALLPCDFDTVFHTEGILPLLWLSGQSPSQRGALPTHTAMPPQRHLPQNLDRRQCKSESNPLDFHRASFNLIDDQPDGTCYEGRVEEVIAAKASQLHSEFPVW
jgi:hypothetical protein